MADSYIQVLTESGFAQTPDIARLDVTGDIEIRVRLAAADWEDGLTRAGLLQKWGGSPTTRSYRLKIQANGAIRLEVSDGSSTLGATSSTRAWADGLVTDVRATLDLTDGANSVWTYYVREAPSVPLSSDTSWALVSSHTQAPIASINNSNEALQIPGNDQRRMTGKWYRALVYNGIGGTIVSDWKPLDPATMQTPGDESAWLDQAPAAANVFTMQGAEVTDWSYTDLSGGASGAVAGAKLSHEHALEAAGLVHHGAFAPHLAVRPPPIVSM